MIFEVKSPILGFEDYVVKMKLEKIDEIFMRLSNVDAPAPVLVLWSNPFILREYDFEVPVAMKLLLISKMLRISLSPISWSCKPQFKTPR